MPSTDQTDSPDPGSQGTNETASQAEAPAPTRNMTLKEIISGVKRRNGAFPMKSSVERSEQLRRKRRRAAAGLPDEEEAPSPAAPRPPTPPSREEEPPQDQVVAPQMTIDRDGNIVIDQDSLVVNPDTAAPFEEDRRTVTVDINGLGNRITSATYGKRESAHKWSERETDRFYQALRMFGTDFSLMERSFPKRSRRQLKLKFKREEKENPKRVDETLSAPPIPMPRTKPAVPVSDGSQVTGADGVTRSAAQQQDPGGATARSCQGDDGGKQAEGGGAGGKKGGGKESHSQNDVGENAVHAEGRSAEVQEENGGEIEGTQNEGSAEGEEGNLVDTTEVGERSSAEGEEAKVVASAGGKKEGGEKEGSAEDSVGKSGSGLGGNDEGSGEDKGREKGVDAGGCARSGGNERQSGLVEAGEKVITQEAEGSS